MEEILASPVQKRTWLLGKAGYPLQYALSLTVTGAIGEDRILEALRRITERHEILRTRFRQPPYVPYPVQVVEETARPRFTRHDISHLAPPEQSARVQEVLDGLLENKPGPGQAPALTVVLLALAPDRGQLLISLPALADDAHSMLQLAAELAALCTGPDRDEPGEALPHQFGQFAEWHNEMVEEPGEEAQAFWEEQPFRAWQHAVLPFERYDEREKGRIGRLRHAGSPGFSEALHAFCAREDVPAETFLMACWQVLLWQYLDGLSEVVVGKVAAGRQYEEFAGIAGPLNRTLPVQTRIAGTQTIREVCRLVGETERTAGVWQDNFRPGLPAADAGPDGRLRLEDVPYFSAGFEYCAYQACPAPAFRVDGVFGTGDVFKLKLGVLASEEALHFDFYYLKEWFDAGAVACIRERFAGVVAHALRAPGAPLSELVQPSAAEAERLLSAGDDTRADNTGSRPLADWFEEQARVRPAQPAVVLGDRQYTYGELNDRANRVARFLAEACGAGPGTVVGVWMSRSAELIVNLLGILKTGAAYLPIDAAAPPERAAFMLADAGARAVLTEAERQLPGTAIPRLTPGAELPAAGNPARRRRMDDPVYVIYTSGSTGRPKGVVIGNAALSNYVQWFNTRFSVGPSDRTLLLSSVAFDLCYTSLWTALAAGATLHILPETVPIDPEALTRVLADGQITYLKLTPSHFSILLNTDFEARVQGYALRLLVLGGEPIAVAGVEKYWMHRPDVTFVNHYGPTETTIGCIHRVLRPADLAAFRQRPVIGRPIRNTRVYVLDPARQPVPVGVAGEIAIAGEGLAAGYLNHAALTDEKFPASPWQPATRLYLTGDVGRWTPEGEIEFLGRRDNQVKVRGYRIELTEVEATLRRHPGVKNAVVVLHRSGAGDPETAGYAETRQPVTTAELRAYLEQQLPPYMVPDHLVTLDRLPLAGNGKVDYKRLPSPETLPEATGGYEPPRNPTEAALVAIWQEVLGRERIGIRDHFFRIGGHSLKATRVMSRIHKELKARIELRNIFACPTVAELAAVIGDLEKVSCEPIRPLGHREHYDLSHAQQRLWLSAQFAGKQHVYNMPAAYVFRGELNRTAFAEAFAALVNRHEILRTTFATVAGAPRQIVHPGHAFPFRVGYVDLRRAADAAAELERLVQEDAVTPFDLGTAPPLRAQLVQVADAEYLFLFCMHHIISDGWSLEILVSEILAGYNARNMHLETAVPPLRIQYKDYAHWQNQLLAGEAISRSRAYWLHRFSGPVPVLELPTDYPRTAARANAGGAQSSLLGEALSRQLKQLGHANGASLFMVLIAAVNTLLFRLSGQTDIVIGTPIAGREHTDLENQIGPYLNSLPLRTRFSRDETFTDLLAKVKEVVLGAFEHQLYPFDQMVENLRLPRDASRSPLFDVVVMFDNTQLAARPANGLAGVAVTPYETEERISTIDLRIVFREEGARISLEIGYNRGLFRSDTIGLLVERLTTLLTCVAADPGTVLGAIVLGSGAGPDVPQNETDHIFNLHF